MSREEYRAMKMFLNTEWVTDCPDEEHYVEEDVITKLLRKHYIYCIDKNIGRYSLTQLGWDFLLGK